MDEKIVNTRLRLLKKDLTKPKHELHDAIAFIFRNLSVDVLHQLFKTPHLTEHMAFALRNCPSLLSILKEKGFESYNVSMEYSVWTFYHRLIRGYVPEFILSDILQYYGVQTAWRIVSEILTLIQQYLEAGGIAECDFRKLVPRRANHITPYKIKIDILLYEIETMQKNIRQFRLEMEENIMRDVFEMSVDAREPNCI